jgi:hypothetical protein
MQDHFGRAEGYGIVHADEQFFVPTDGKPLRGLIQVGDWCWCWALPPVDSCAHLPFPLCIGSHRHMVLP